MPGPPDILYISDAYPDPSVFRQSPRPLDV